jgi:hypothetical protein
VKAAAEAYQKKYKKNKEGPKPKWFYSKANRAII